MQKFRIPKTCCHPVVDGDYLTAYYHMPLLRHFFISRLELIYRFIRNEKFRRVLELGFGSGVFFPQLKNLADEVFAVDIHSKFKEVRRMLEYESLKVHLVKADVMRLPFKDGFFDCVISTSMLEHVEPLGCAMNEISRVVRGGGSAVLGFPVDSKLTHFLLRAMGSESDHKKKLRQIHPNTHGDIMDVARKTFGNIQVKSIPGFLPVDFSLYCGCLCRKGG